MDPSLPSRAFRSPLALLVALALSVGTLPATATAGPPGHVLPRDAGAQALGPVSGQEARRFTPALAEAFDRYVDEAMDRASVPGVAVAIVQHGSIVHERGFGVRALGSSAPVRPTTRMMIASTGKSMTATLMAALADTGVIDWSTRAIDILPTFALSDARLTPQVTLADLVCNCTGVERRDLELFFPDRPRIALQTIRSLATIPIAPGTFRRNYQYSNQMVAAGGYLAGLAAEPTAEPGAAYRTEMQTRVFDPIGMTRTTFSTEAVLADDDHALPTATHLDLTQAPLALDAERWFDAVAPAGGAWSDAHDLGRYLITQLAGGVAPDGRRVVSRRNLTETWRPRVEIGDNLGYALGWVATTWEGTRMLTHDGATGGFTSDLTFLPDADLGIAIVTNAQEAGAFTTAIRRRALELAFDRPPDGDEAFTEALAAARRAAEEARSDAMTHGTLLPAEGRYANTMLGTVSIRHDTCGLTMDTGLESLRLRPDGDGGLVVWNGPVPGDIRITADAAGFTLLGPNSPEPYRFSPAARMAQSSMSPNRSPPPGFE